VKAKFKEIAEKNIGRILFMDYGRNKEKTLAFSPIPPIKSNMQCSECKTSQWNATNFSNNIHFCPDREIEIEITDYCSVFKP
jgi:hypothetical protein